jgi:nicotinamidase/pyrazinamidase
MSASPHPDPSTTALVVVDLQPDFLPGGALAVAGGDLVIEPIARLLTAGRYTVAVATQDWHPSGHVSFASSHPGRRPFDVIELYGREQVLWPDHCVQGSAGARLHDSLPLDHVGLIIRKGTDPRVDSYSTFRNNWDAIGRRPLTGLAGYLRERAIETVVLCGLARDYCVKWSAEDAVAAGFRTVVLWDLTRPVDPRSDAAVAAGLRELGVAVVPGLDPAELLPGG